MRRYAPYSIGCLFVLSVAFSLPLKAAVIEWSGAGANSVASNPLNWQGGVVPGSSDTALFDDLNPTKSCDWNITASVQQIQIGTSYTAAVTASVGFNLQDLTLQGGTFNMGPHEHALTGNFTHTGGVFTAANNGTLRLTGSSPQSIAMLIQPATATTYQSYFFNFRVAGSNVISATTDMIIDGSFSLSAGQFSAGSSTLTLTGGRHVSAGAGPLLNWSDTGGTFTPGTGLVRLVGGDRGYRLNQKAGNTFTNLSIEGDLGTTVVSNTVINGDLSVLFTGASAVLDLGEFLTHSIQGKTVIGPSSFPANPTIRLGRSTFALNDNVSLGTATVVIEGGDFDVLASQLLVTTNGTLHFNGGNTGRLRFSNGSLFHLAGGRLLATGNGRITSVAPGTDRYTARINGTVDIRAQFSLASMDQNGFHFGLGSNVLNLSSLIVDDTPGGGAGLNFDPVVQASIQINDPEFKLSVSTNIRANFVGGISPPGAQVVVVDPLGPRGTASYENDPSGMVHWGILGQPTNFDGSALSASQMRWSWTIVNEPLGFEVKDEGGTSVSATLGANETEWTETGLSPNTPYTRFVQAFTDSGTENSSNQTRYTLANPASSAQFTGVHVSSLTISWNTNGNSAATIYRLEQRNDDGDFVEITQGTAAQINPTTLTGLTPVTIYTFRVVAINGEGVASTASNVIQSVTLPAPPPIVNSIQPSVVENLGTRQFTITGSDFHSDAAVLFKKGAAHPLVPKNITFIDEFTLVVRVPLTGAFQGTWDIHVENPDGKISLPSGADLLTISNASSTPHVRIHPYEANKPFTLETPGRKTRLRMSPNTMPNARIYLTEDPVNTPLAIEPSAIETALENLVGWQVVPGTIREILAYDEFGVVTSNFENDAQLSLSFPDENNDGIVDSILTRIEKLKVMTLNETSLVWEDVKLSLIEQTEGQVTAHLEHFSVYAVFGALPPNDLDTAFIYPNPWQPSSGTSFDATHVTFSNLTESGSIKILTLDGRLVRQLSYGKADAGAIPWDGTNTDGLKVASGIYFVFVEGGNGARRILKLGVER